MRAAQQGRCKADAEAASAPHARRKSAYMYAALVRLRLNFPAELFAVIKLLLI